MNHELVLVDKLLRWLVLYVVALVVLGWAFNKVGDVLPVLTHLITGISSAAFAIMRVSKTKDEPQKPTENPPHAGVPSQ